MYPPASKLPFSQGSRDVRDSLPVPGAPVPWGRDVVA
jgi:hypothetical protein